jgi:hypothetical protein
MNTDKKTRLFILKNTTHYLNARLYLEGKEPSLNYVFLTIRNFKGFQDLINKIKDDPLFKLVGLIIVNDDNSTYNTYTSLLKYIIKVKKLAVKFPYFDEVLFTNYKSWLHHFIVAQFKTERTVLISDGAGIIIMSELRHRQKAVPFESVPFKGHPIFLKKILGIKPIQNLHFFSQISLDVPVSDSLEVFHFKASPSNKICDKKVYFIGSPLVELGFISLEKNLEYLRTLKEELNGAKIYYFAHRREQDQNLKKYDFLGEIVHSHIPFESKLEATEELPGAIISFISSVLINLASAYPKIIFYYYPIKLEDIPEDISFYENYKTTIRGFEQISEPNFRKFTSSQESNELN